ncbi:MAG: polynucleotide kinase-phosphatase [Polyangiaceae bacterium]
MTFQIPKLSLVVLVGVSGSGKSTFARKHFKPTEIISSDYCRGLVSDDENNQAATNDAFDVLHYIAGKRLVRGLLTVVDATNVQKEARKPLVALARQHHCIPVAIVLNMPTQLCVARNESRPDRNFGARVVAQQQSQLRGSIKTLKREGFRHVHVMSGPEEVESAVFERVPLWNDKRDQHGPFDIIGDVHGCFSELCTLLEKLGYAVNREVPSATPPNGRRAVFLGDLVDRGPATPAVLRLVMNMVRSGHALCVPGNHDVKLMRKLRGKNVQLKHGLQMSVDQLEPEPDELKTGIADFIDGLVSHYVLDDGNLVVAHAGMREALQGRGSGAVREFALYGETTGEVDEYGLPIRYNWAADYRGRAMVVYGHTPVPTAEWVNRTICIDTGCVFGGSLTALRYPEKELIEVEAEKMYFEPAKPLVSEQATADKREYHDLLDIEDVRGKRIVSTRIHHTVTIREQNSTAALELMGRYAVDPHWLVYLPPTMSPSETAAEGPLLEHPREAFDYFRRNGVGKVVCEEKHMGSRAVLVVCRDEEVAKRRFGATDGRAGIVHTRTGRPFFNDLSLENELLARVRDAATTAGLWSNLATDWLCLDAELMPWSAKAQELLRDQYAAVGCAAGKSLGAASAALAQARARLDGEQAELLASVQARIEQREQAAAGFIDAYRQYCWPVSSIDDIKLAPFHLLASEARVHTDQNHVWHMDTLAKLAEAEPVLMATPYKVIELADPASEQEGIAWWESLTGRGGEGMVVKPLDWIVRGKRGLIQPAIKCRGPEYLRIIYGPEYLLPENLERLRRRGTGTKRALALREFALGIEALHRFVENEPLYRVHECVFGVLALESEPVDPGGCDGGVVTKRIHADLGDLAFGSPMGSCSWGSRCGWWTRRPPGNGPARRS